MGTASTNELLGFHAATQAFRIDHGQCWACDAVKSFGEMTMQTILGKQVLICDLCKEQG